jgi:DNA-binding NarL/FixJ family response regulator
VLGAEPDLEVVGEAADGAEVVPLARRLRPDVVLMDVRMPAVDGIRATELLLRGDDAPRVLVLTTFENDDNVVLALQAGASGFLGKNVAPAELAHAIRVVAAGEALLSPKATRALVSRFVAQIRPAPASRLAALDHVTERETEILILVAHGLSNDDIAARLHVSPLTVKTHVNRTMIKLNARDCAQLVVIAYQNDLVRPDDPLPAV